MAEKTAEDLRLENEKLKEQLGEAEDVLRAIRSGEIDALVSFEQEDERIYTLKSADQGYRLLVESINEGAVILSPDDSIYYANPRFEEMVKKDARKIPGTPILDFVHQENRGRFETLLVEAGLGQTARGEIRLRAADGTLLPVSISLSLLDLEEFRGLCAIFTDMSEQKFYTERLEQRNQELQDFAFVASHDLQEPLRKITTFGDRLNRRYGDKLDEKGKDYLDRMLRSTGRMRSLLDGLLEYSRITTNPEPFTEVDLNDVVREVLSDLEVSIENTGARVEAGELPTVSADPTQMQQLFQNLIANSLKFRREGERPVIKVNTAGAGTKPGNNLRITVEDNGIGFKEDYLDKIFVPFQRLHGRTRFEGTGMGLAICKKIVERHGGNISARSTPGKGSVFIVTLPVSGAG